ncbi:MAG: hypothetical protein JXR96_28160 [Deltaproteobacteria bacterium]|nr:hypothetical protein [Deltaproteobacteria bacterium]
MRDEKLSQASHIFLAVSFLGLLWLPLLGMLTGVGIPSVKKEKRRPSEAPTLETLMHKGAAAFRDQFSHYFNDHFGFRSQLIEGYNLAKYYVFSVSGSSRVTIGQDGWLFYTSAVKDYRTRRPFSAAALGRIQAILEQRRKWLAGKGIDYLFVIAPNKSTIYPEHLPDHIHRLAKKSKLDQLAEHLQHKSSLAFLDLRKPLLETKEIHQTFSRTDTHWNDSGAFAAYEEIMKALGMQPLAAGRMRSIPVAEQSGDLARLLSLDAYLTDKSVQVVPKGGFSARLFSEGHRGGRLVSIKENEQPDLPSLLVFGDSFTERTRLKDYLGEHFRRSVFVRGESDFFDTRMVETEHPDIVIQEMVERFMMAPFQDNPVEVSQPGLPLLQSLSAENLDGMRPMNQVDIRSEEEALVVESLGRDPHFQLPEMPLGECGQIVVQVDLDSPVDTFFQLFYLAPGERRYSEKSSVVKKIRAGRGRLSLRVPKAIGRLRLDPGREAGAYRIYSIEVFCHPGIVPFAPRTRPEQR